MAADAPQLPQYSTHQEEKRKIESKTVSLKNSFQQSHTDLPLTCYGGGHLRNLPQLATAGARKWCLYSGQDHHVAQLQGDAISIYFFMD